MAINNELVPNTNIPFVSSHLAMQKYFDTVIATISNSPSPKTLRIVRLQSRLISQDYSDKVSLEVPIVLMRSESSLLIEASGNEVGYEYLSSKKRYYYLIGCYLH